MKEAFAIIAALLAVVGNVPYLIEIWRGNVKPQEDPKDARFVIADSLY